MPESKYSNWRAAIAAECHTPQGSLCLQPEERQLRLYPQFTASLKLQPISLQHLLAETRHDHFLRGIYQHVLLRPPDPEGFTYHLGRLKRGDISPLCLLLDLRLSGEGRMVNRKITGLWLMGLLHRLRPFIPKRLMQSQKLIRHLIKNR